MAEEKWSQDVTEHSDALDLDEGVFTWSDPTEIARSLLRSAQTSTRRRATSPYRSAMSMLTFYISSTLRALHAAPCRTSQSRSGVASRQCARTCSTNSGEPMMSPKP
ncbi:DUF3175 domain-containing protein [Tsukamurella soli]|uniref:DUF3175 domain-containing protein n=1 Tax=Tsukamurella soli TaxID=644556 RepID=UPI0031ED911B